jgi:alcohol dehydrogenase
MEDRMKAAVLEKLGSPLVVRELPDPVMGTGEVIVDMAATGVLAYAGDVYSGKRPYLLELPIVPGAGGVGRIAAVGPDATHLKLGDWVSCDPTVRSRDKPVAPDIILQGLTAGTPAALPMQRYYHDGSYAQKLRTPTENVTPIGDIDPADAARWVGLGPLMVPYGGWLAGGLKAGQIALVNGATGAFGSAGVAVALALGARAVIATGRNQAALDELRRRYGPRVIPVRMAVEEEADRRAMLAAAPGPIDCVLDLLPPAATPAQVRAALMTVRPYGTVVLMGGLGMQPEIQLPYSWLMRFCITVRGQWMFPREALATMVGMVRAGLIDLGHHTVKTFPLDRVNEAVAHAAAHAGPFSRTVLDLRPS